MRTPSNVALLLLALGACASTPEAEVERPPAGAPPAPSRLPTEPATAADTTAAAPVSATTTDAPGVPATAIGSPAATTGLGTPAATADLAAPAAATGLGAPAAAATPARGACLGPAGAVNPPRPREGAGCPPMTQLLALTPIVVLRHPTDRLPQLPADGLSLAIDGALLPGRFAVGENVQLCVPGGPRTVTFCAGEAQLAELVLEPPVEKKILVGKGSLGPPPGLPPGFGPKGVPRGPIPTGVPTAPK